MPHIRSSSVCKYLVYPLFVPVRYITIYTQRHNIVHLYECGWPLSGKVNCDTNIGVCLEKWIPGGDYGWRVTTC